MKRILLLLIHLSLLLPVLSQSTEQKKSQKRDIGIAVSGSIHVPVGNFAATHVLGAGISISPSYHTVGLFTKTKIAFTCNGGVAYYLGKKETVSSYPYTYPGYFFIHAFAGALLIPNNKMELSLTAGPALGLYNGNNQFNIGSKLELNYHLTNKVAAGPGIIFMKESGADALWAASVKVAISF